MKAKNLSLALWLSAVVASLAACIGKSAAPPAVASRETERPTTATSAPQLLKLRGLLQDKGGARLTGVVGVQFAIYEEKEGGAPLLMEIQNVEVNERGYFSALVGSTMTEGVPRDLLRSTEPRWLGMQILLPGEVEQPRMIMKLLNTPDGLETKLATMMLIPPDSAGEETAADTAAEAASDFAKEPASQDKSAPGHRSLRTRRRSPSGPRP